MFFGVAAGVLTYLFVGNDVGMSAAVFCLVYIAAFIYLLPAHIAERRHHPQLWAIWTLTFFGAWTGLLWIAALVWSLAATEER